MPRCTRLVPVAMAVAAFAAPCLAQDVRPPKNATTIIIHTSDSPEVAYQTIARVLLTRGYGLQSSDAAIGSVTTTFRETSGAGPVQVSAFVLRDSSVTAIQLTGVWKFTMGAIILKGSEDSPLPISYGGSGGSPKRKAWDELNAIGAAYPGGCVLYVDPKTGEVTTGTPK